MNLWIILYSFIKVPKSTYMHFYILYTSKQFNSLIKLNIFQMNINSVNPLHLLLLISLLPLLSAKFNVVSAYKDGEQVSVCFADCSSCSFNDRQCETCYAPFYVKDQSGNCNISQTDQNPNYRLESTAEEQRTDNFLASPAWFINGSNIIQTNCTPNSNDFEQTISIMGPFSAQTVTYRRTISIHDYFAVKFMLVLIDWCPDCSLKITITNEDSKVLDTVTVSVKDSNIQDIAKEQLCSSSASDYRLSLNLQMEETTSRQLTITFEPSSQNPENSQWGLSTFVLLTGRCNQNCETCEGFSPNIENCKICKNFFSNLDSNNLCSTCRPGFQISENQDQCLKCQIQYQYCDSTVENPPLTCQYPEIANDTTTCTFPPLARYDSKKYSFNQIFSGSLFNIYRKGSSVFTCGSYSMVGLANKGDIIVREFFRVEPHIAFSFLFNVFIVDQKDPIQKYTFIMFIEGKVVDNLSITVPITGTSNECGEPTLYEAFQTIGPFPFYDHTQTSNVVIGVGGDTIGPMKWGIRDIRLVYLQCDEKCLSCTNNGCEICPNNLQLKKLRCDGCVAGMGLFKNQTCDFCLDNCKVCSSKTTCSECFIGFYLYQEGSMVECRRDPNYYKPIESKDSDWIKADLSNEGTCTLKSFANSQSNETSQTKYDFVVAEDRMQTSFSLPQPHYKVKIEFMLMKIDDWEEDRLNVYANDLLIIDKTFSSFGNKICFEDNQTEQISFEEHILEDNNNTMTIQFEVVHKNISKTKKFGVSAFKLYQIGCEKCQKQSFKYKVQYTTDDALHVLMEFNRIYQMASEKQFKKLFYIKIDDKLINNYTITFSDKIRYWLRYEGQDKELIEKKISVICKYPKQAITNIQNTNANNRLFARLLQKSNENNLKTLDVSSASTKLMRFTPLNSRLESLLGLKTFFDVITRIVIYVGFASFFFGCQTGCTHMMHNFQKIWVFIYVASLSLSPIFKVALLGFREIQNQNIAINPQGWQESLPDPLYFDLPAQFELYYEDNAFFRNIYSVGIAFLIIAVVYIIGFLVFRNRLVKEDEFVMKHFKITFSETPYFYWNSVVYYQYFTVVLACCLQFMDLRPRNHTNSSFPDVNAAAAVIAFILATIYPWIHFFYMRSRKAELIDVEEVESNLIFVFKNRYAEIFFRFMKIDIQPVHISHFIYNVFRFGQLWWTAIVVCLMYNAPFTQSFVLMLLHAFHFFYVLFSSKNRSKGFRFLKAFESLFFAGLAILILVMVSLVDSLTTQSFQTLGIVAVVFIFVIITLSTIRMIYTWVKIVREYRKSEESYRRNLRYYDEDNLQSENVFQ